MSEKKHEEKDGDQMKAVKSSHSIAKKKLMSKTAVVSKASLKKITDSAVLSTISISSSSLGIKRQSEYEKLAKGPKYQNTYRLDSKKPFKTYEVYKILESVVLKEVEDHSLYDPLAAPKITQTIAADVRTAVRALNYDRYKICVLVYMGEKKLQGLQCAFRALWDHERDGWTSYFFQTRAYFVSCICYGLYHD